MQIPTGKYVLRKMAEKYCPRSNSHPSLSLERFICDSCNIPFAAKGVEVKPKHQKQKEGSRVEFKCIYHGNEKVSYCWLKDGTEIHGQDSSTFVLDCVELRDFGWYECRVTFADGDRAVSSYGELDVVPRDGMGKCCFRQRPCYAGTREFTKPRRQRERERH